jgi:drug/metabolite transporter (DMT)-like permease
MAQPPVPHRSQVAAHPVTAAAIAVVLIAAVFFALYVPLYARATPKVGDFPFFYFFLLIYMPVVSLACWLVLVLQKRLRAPGDAPLRQDGEPR